MADGEGTGQKPGEEEPYSILSKSAYSILESNLNPRLLAEDAREGASLSKAELILVALVWK